MTSDRRPLRRSGRPSGGAWDSIEAFYLGPAARRLQNTRRAFRIPYVEARRESRPAPWSRSATNQAVGGQVRAEASRRLRTLVFFFIRIRSVLAARRQASSRWRRLSSSLKECESSCEHSWWSVVGGFIVVGIVNLTSSLKLSNNALALRGRSADGSRLFVCGVAVRSTTGVSWI
jgi:hypothetical protein